MCAVCICMCMSCVFICVYVSVCAFVCDMCAHVCTHVCSCECVHVCVCMCKCRCECMACIGGQRRVWDSVLVSHFVFMQSRLDCFRPWAAVQGVSVDSPVFHFTSAALGLQMWVLGIQTLIPTHAWQVLYLLSHLNYVPTHVYSFKGST